MSELYTYVRTGKLPKEKSSHYYYDFAIGDTISVRKKNVKEDYFFGKNIKVFGTVSKKSVKGWLISDRIDKVHWVCKRCRTILTEKKGNLNKKDLRRL